MSALYFELYVGKDDEVGLKVTRNFFSLSKSKNWDGLIEMFGDSCNKVVERSADAPRQSLYKDFEHYFELSVSETQTENAVMFEFDTFTSFSDYEFIKLLLKGGAKRIEANIDNSQVGESYFYENELYSEEYHKTQWIWLPEPDVIDDEE